MDFFDWATLLTYACALAATALLTQWLKGVFANIPTQIVSYGIALVVLIAATFFTGALTVESGVLCLINAALVSLASNGAYEAVQRAKK